MNNDSIIPEYEEHISIIKALEYLAYKWEPYVDYDEILTGQDRAQIRGNGYFEQKDYTDAINQAAAKLGNLIRNRKIKLCPKELIPVISNSNNIINSSFIIHPDSYRENKIQYSNSKGNIIDNGKIEGVQIKFMKINKNDSIPSYIDAQSITHTATMENNCYYIPVCIIDYGFSKFMYPDWKSIIKFSELEQYEEVKIENRGRKKTLLDNDIAICLLEHIDEILSKENKLQEQKQDALIKAIKNKYPNVTLQDRTIIDKIRPYLSIFDGKYIEIHNN